MDSEHDLLLQAKAHSQQAFSRLQEQYAPVIQAQIASVLPKVEERLHDDCRQEALLAFHRAILSYDLSQNKVTFGLYAKICMHNRLSSFLRKQKKAQMLLTEVELSSQEDVADHLVSHDALEARFHQLSSLLSPLEKEVLLRCSAGEKPREIARSLGKAPKVIYNALSRIQAKRKGMKSQ